MSTEIYEAPFDLFAPSYSFDALLERGGNFRVTPTSRKIEGEGNISDHLASEPSGWTLRGKVSANQLDPNTLQVQPLSAPFDKLEELVKKKAIVLVLSGDAIARYLAIVQGNVTQSNEDGNAVNADIQLQEMRTTAPKTVQIPPSRMRRKARRKATKPAKGGAAKPRPASTDNRGNMLKTGEGLAGRRIG